MSEINWKPIGNKIIVKKLEIDDEVTSSGLFIVSHEKNDKTKKAEVVAVGSGMTVNGVLIPLEISVGDIVIYNGMYGTDIGSFHTSETNEYMILHEEDIVGVLESA